MLEAVSRLRSIGCRLAGFVAPEERRNGRRIGFKLVDISSAREWCLARRGFQSPIRVGSYGVCVRDVEAAARVVRENIPQAQIIVVDEIGPMELRAPALRDLIIGILSLEKLVIGVVHRKLKYSYPRIYELVRRKGVILWLTPENRSLIRQRFLMLVEEMAVEACGGEGGEGAPKDSGSRDGSAGGRKV